MNNRLKHISFSFLFFVAIITGCTTVHEFPEFVPPAETAEVTIAIDINMAFDSDTIFQTYSQMLTGDYDVRYIVDIYKKDDSRQNGVTDKVLRITKTENTIISNGIYQIKDTVQLPIDKYEIMVWMDFVDKGTTTDKYYKTTDLQEISVIQQSGGNSGYNTTKDAFAGKDIMDLTPYLGQTVINHSTVVDTKRPFAIYEIRTTDIDEYRTYHQTLSYSSIQPNITNVLYNLYFPMGYNAYLFAPDNLQTNIHYTYDIVETTPDKEAILASDLVFVEDDTFYLVDFEIISADGRRINTVQGLKIELKRNKRTIIRSEFLTKDLNPDNAIGVDDSFVDEIIVNI